MNYRNIYKKITASVLILAFVLGSVLSAYPMRAEAAINRTINYQGKLTNTSNLAVADGLYNAEFKLYTQLSGGSPIWTETLTTTNRIVVTNGLFSVMLGSTTPFTGVDFNQTLYLGINIESDGEMSPRKILGAVPAAFVADTLDNISSEQFLRADTSNSTSTASTFLTFVQSGAGKIAEFFGQASASVLALLSNGNVGIGTTTPYAKLSVAGEVVAQNFTATSTATSTFGGNLAIRGTGTTTSAGGINLSAGCYAVNGVCVGASTYGNSDVNSYINGSSTIAKTYTSNVFTALQNFLNASSTRFSVVDTLYVGGTATTTFQGNSTGTSTIQGFLNVLGTNSTSTFSGALSATNLNATNINASTLTVTGTGASSTFANGINLSNGCFATGNNCIVGGGTAGQVAYYEANGSAVVGTSTLVVSASNYGSVGVGTSIPGYKLDVLGTANFEGGSGSIAAPTYNSPSPSGGASSYFAGDNLNYRSYSYKNVNGTRYYSALYSEHGDQSISNNGDVLGVNYDVIPAGIDGIRVLRDYNFSGFADYRDVTGSFVDDGSGWSGSPVVTPTAESFSLRAGYNDGTTKWSAYGNSGAYFGGNVGVGTTSPAAALAITGGFFTTATSTGMNGINLTSGCFAVNNVCVGGGAGSYGDTNVNSYINSSTTIPKTYTTNVFTGLQNFLNASSSLASVFNTLYIGGTATTTLQGNTTGTSTIQGFLNVSGTNSTSTFSGNVAVQGTTTANTSLSGLYTDNNRWLKLNELASTRAWNRFTQINPFVATTSFHVPTNYYLATSTVNISAAIASNNSGATYNPVNNSMFFINNSNIIYEFTLEGTPLRTITLTGFTDTEALGWMYDDMFVIGDEQGGALTWIRIPNSVTTTLAKSSGTSISTAASIGTSNSTIEGVTYDPDRDVFYVAKEGTGTTAGIYQVTRDGTVTSLFATTTWQTNGIGDASDIYYDRNSEHLFVAVDQCYGEANGPSSTRCDGVMELTLAGQILDKIAAPSGFTQVEGIGFTPDGQNMFMSSEADMYAWYKFQDRGPLTFAQTSTTTPVNLGIGTSSPVSTLSIRGTAGTDLLTISSSTNAVLLSLLQNGNLGVGTSSAYARLSVSGNGVFDDYVRSSYFIATSTATSTFVGGISTNTLNVSSTTASSTFANGINLTSGCFAVNNVCVGGGAGSYGDTNVNSYINSSTTIPKTYTTNVFTGLQNFLNASSSLASVFNTLYIGGTATTTLQGNTTGTSTIQGFLNVSGTNSTSTFSGGVSLTTLSVTGATASSTFANGINLTAGCFSINNTCVGGGGSSQWTTSGSDITYVTGNVGIGTTTPYAKLSVVGQIVGEFFTATSTTASTTLLGGFDAGNNGGFSVSKTAPKNSLVVDSGGAVRAGTGCNNPTVAFTVCGSQATVVQYISNSATDAYALSQTSDGDTLYFGLRSSTQGFLQYPSGGLLRIEQGGGTLGTALLQTLGGGGSTAPTASSFSWGAANLYQVLSTGQTLAPTLNSGTPSYSFTADTNTGTYRVGEDIIGFATGGAETLRIGTASSSLSQGNFGVGTTSPYAKLSVVGEIVGANFTGTTTATSTFGGNLAIQGTGTTTSAGGINLSAGCYAVNGVCIGNPAPGSGVPGSGVTDALTYWTSSGTIGATTTPTVGAIFATSTTATSTFAGAIKIGSGNLLPTAPFQVGGSIDSYLQANIQNLSAGNSASSDWIATNDIGGDDSYYVDLGINSSTYNNPLYTIVGPNDAYLYAQTNALSIGTATTSALGVIKFHTGGTLAANERMRIDVNGNVGIGTTSPWARLSIVDNTASPEFVIATSSGAIPLFFVNSTTTGALDWQRIGIGTSTIGAAGLRDQLVVSGRIYSTWREVSCDSIGASLAASLSTTDVSSFCGVYAYDANTDSRLVLPTASPAFGRLEAGFTTTAALNEAATIRTALIMAKGENPVFETKVKNTGTLASSTITLLGFYGSAMATATPAMMPSNGVFFIATSTPTWIAMSRKADVNEYTNTGVATSTTFQKLRIELTATDATFLMNDTVVARHTNSATLPTVALAPTALVGVTSAGTIVANGRAIDIQYIKSWVDDPPTPIGETSVASSSESVITPEAELRDLGRDDVTQGGSIAMSYVADKNKVTEEGTIVSFDEGHEFRVRASKGAYDTKIAGVVSAASNSVHGQEHLDTIRIATMGRASVRVSLENGPIAIGDYITSSSKEGVGMKATQSGQVIGRALQAFTATSSEKTIVVNIHPTDHLVNTSLFAYNESAQKDIVTIEHGIDWVRALRPVSFNYKADGSPSIGLLPEDVGVISPSLVSLDSKGKAVSVRYELLPVVLTQAIKELDARVTILENHILSASSTVVGTIEATSTVATVIEAFRGLGTLIENGIASFKSIFADKVSTKELCLDDLCVTRDELQSLLDNARINAHTSATTTPTVAPVITPDEDTSTTDTNTSSSTPSVEDPTETSPDTEAESGGTETVSDSQPSDTPSPEPASPEPTAPEPAPAPAE